MMDGSRLRSLREELRSSDAARRIAAAQSLARDPRYSAALSCELIESLTRTGGDEELQAWLVESLENADPPDAGTAPQLTRQFQTNLSLRENGLAAYWGATLLGRIGPAAADAVPALIAALESHDAGMRGRAAWALGKIGPPARTAIEPLRSLAAAADPRAAATAAEALARIEAR